MKDTHGHTDGRRKRQIKIEGKDKVPLIWRKKNRKRTHKGKDERKQETDTDRDRGDNRETDTW